MQEIAEFEKTLTKNHSYRRGEHLDQFDKSLPILGMLKSGSARTELLSATGERHIIGFHLTGDFIGFGIANLDELDLHTACIFLSLPSFVCCHCINFATYTIM